METLGQILLYSTIAGLATTVGSLITLILGNPKEKLLAALLAGACGIMSSVFLIDLLPTAWLVGPKWQILPGFIFGWLFMHLGNKQLNAPAVSSIFSRRQRLKRIGLLVAAGIALHDLPEGMAIAAGHETTPELGFLIALAIAVHNLPEGMATATPLVMAKIRPWKILALTGAIALFTPLGTLIGMLAIKSVHNSLAFFLALAAGSMAYLVLTELWPLSRERHPHYALLGGTLGLSIFSIISLFIA